VEKIVYHNRNTNIEADKLGCEYTSFDDLLKQSDFIICSCSATKQTEKIFNKEAFSKMKSTSIFINISRGIVVDQDDLYDALANNVILAAGLDVTTPQPLPLNHKLFQLQNCFITPYLAPSDVSTRIKMSVTSVANLIHGLNDESLVFEVKA
jgi:glyoxylate/hydroxypyruvate reductase